MSKILKNTCLLFMMLLTIIFVFQNNQINGAQDTDVTNVIEKYFSYMGNDWDRFSELYEDSQVDSMRKFMNDTSNVDSHEGVLNVKNASLLACSEISYDEATELLSEIYIKNSSRFFVVKGNYLTYDDTDYFKTGIQYNLISLIQEDDSWKVCEFAGYEYSDCALNTEMNSLEKSNFSINMLPIVSNSVSTVAETSSKAKNKRTIPTDNTTIVYGTYDSSGNYKSKKTLNFHDYCIGVTAGECRGAEFNGKARKAIIMAIKTYTWHYKIVPIDSVHGVNIKNTMQSYAPGKVSENSKVTSNYNVIKNIWMESYSGAIFEALYRKGTYGDQTNCKNGGELKQEGCRYLVDKKNKTFYGCVHYYYDNSSASTGGKIRFFDNNKDVIDK